MNLSWDGWERAIVDLLFPSFPGVSSGTSGHNQTGLRVCCRAALQVKLHLGRGIPVLTSPKGFTVLGKGTAIVFHEAWRSLPLPVSAPWWMPSYPLAATGFLNHSQDETTALFSPCPNLTVPVCKVCFLLEKACPQRFRINLSDFKLSLIDQSSDNEQKDCLDLHLKSPHFSIAAEFHKSICRPFSAQLLITLHLRTLFFTKDLY